MDGTDLADEARAKEGEHTIDLHQGLPEAVRLLGIIGGMRHVPLERDGIVEFNRHGPDSDFEAKRTQPPHDLAMELGDRAGPQRQPLAPAAAGLDQELMIGEVEVDLERIAVIRHQRGGEAPCRDIERDLPPVIYERRLGQADLADHLGPQLQGRTRVVPCRQGQRRPFCGAAGGRDHSL
jgi:hypothetical protein